MDHDLVVRQKMTERYLLDELDPEARNEFEGHFFDCPDCASDVRACALFVEHSKITWAIKSEPIPGSVPAAAIPSKAGWLVGLRAALRPAFAVPVLAGLLAVIGYQNLVMYPQMQQALNRPQLLPWASVNVGTYGSEGPVVTTRAGEGFLLFVRIPPDGSYSRYAAELYDPAGKAEWSLTIPAASTQDATAPDQWPVRVPGANRAAGSYTLAVRGITASGESKEVGRALFELRIQK
ncbi:MAG: zf-HC2 domain-containing protein [Terriglobales bacterium]